MPPCVTLKAVRVVSQHRTTTLRNVPVRMTTRSLTTASSSSPQPHVESRRAVLGAVSAAAIVLGVPPPRADAAGSAVEPPCEYTVTASGLQYCDVREGTGDEPFKGQTIKAHYTGKLASNGRKFDSSYDRGSPLQFKVGAGQVIKGWDMGILGGEGIPPMKEGGLRRLIIPSELGYGKRGAAGAIPPDADLLFDVELIRPSKFAR